MNTSDDDIIPTHSRDFFLFASNIALVLFTIAFVWAGIAFYRSRVSEIALSESRFLRTEWYLLQELKSDTDKRLLEKEREITALRSRYLQLMQNPDLALSLPELMIQLRAAEEERRDILSLRLASLGTAALASSIAPSARSEPSAVEAPTTPSAAETAAQDENATLREAIFSLDAQLSEQKELSRALAVSLADVGEEHRRRVRALEAELALRNERVRNLTVQLSLLIDAKQLAIDKLKGQASASSLEGSYPLDLNAKALMRALASAPEARAQYPELLASIDRYFDEYGRLERARGRAEAYAEAALTLDSLME